MLIIPSDSLMHAVSRSHGVMLPTFSICDGGWTQVSPESSISISLRVYISLFLDFYVHVCEKIRARRPFTPESVQWQSDGQEMRAASLYPCSVKLCAHAEFYVSDSFYDWTG